MQKARRPRVAHSLALLMALWASFPSSAGAQPFHLDTPADSPLWWTLTDDISPEELRLEYVAPGTSQRRYQAAVAAGLEVPKSETELQHLNFYLNPRLTPELETLGNAFHMFAYGWMPLDDRAETERALAEHGVSPDGTQQILATAESYADEFRRLSDQISPKHQELIRIQWEILDRAAEGEGTRARLDHAVQEADVSFFIQRTGRDEETLRDLLRAWKTLPSAVVLTATLPDLESKLSAADWRGLRRYLLGRISQSLGAFSDWAI